MIRIVMILAVGTALWRKVSSKRRYALGVVMSAFLGMGGALVGGLTADLIVGGSDKARDAAVAVGAIALAVAFLTGGELLARRNKGWPLFGPAPERPKRTLRRRR